MTNLNAPWTDDRVERLKALYAEGLSGSQIAKQLGGTTRNSVIGKCHRLGLTGRTYTQPKRKAKRAAPIREADRRASLTLVSPDEPAETGHATWADFAPSNAKGIPAAVIALNDHQCRFPVGETDSPDFHFCMAETDGQSPYCAAHHALCLTPARDPQPRHNGAHGLINYARAG